MGPKNNYTGTNEGRYSLTITNLKVTTKMNYIVLAIHKLNISKVMKVNVILRLCYYNVLNFYFKMVHTA